MKLFELNGKLIEKFKGLEWSTWRCSADTASAYAIATAIKELLPEKYRQYITYHSNNKHLVIFFEAYVAHKFIKYRVFDMNVRTKQDKTFTGYGKRFTIDCFDYELMTYEDYKGESDDIDALLDFTFELAKKDAAKFKDYKTNAIDCVKALSEAVGTKDWTELANMINYIKSNFSDLYNEAGINREK